MEKPYHIYFVCTGNACRSPLAECILKQLLKQTGLTINVSSAGTLNWGKQPSRSYYDGNRRGNGLPAYR